MTESIRLSTLDTHFADFIVRIDRDSGSDLWWGAALASYSARHGHSCYNLTGADGSGLPLLNYPGKQPPRDRKLWQESLQRCETVGVPGEYTPLVLDQAGRLYLHRCWSYEHHVATGILSRRSQPESDDIRREAALDRYFPVQGDTADLQRAAARMALTTRFSVISGGPGTGKTATVARILALLLEMAGDPAPKIVLAAPTGKAALRLRQSVMSAAEHLPLTDAIREQLPVTVSTIHRLLGVRARSGAFRHDRDNRLPCDILVVDEASMIDLRLMAALLQALRDDTRVILLGDRNQLASVESGAVLADICDCAVQADIPVTQLTKSFRFGDDSGIAALSQVINNGNSRAAVELLQSGRFPDIVWKQLPTGKLFDETFKSAVRSDYRPFTEAASPEEALMHINSFRVLSPLRSGPYGIENLNRLCLSMLNSNPESPSTVPVMITGNDYERGLFNGDTGVIVESAGGGTAWFENPEGGLRHISSIRLPPSETAFAVTVHKSQGSEFDRVLLVLPDHMSEALCRELLYTAVTRARRSIEIWGTEEIFCQAIEKRTIRTSGLGERLAAGVPLD